MAAVQGHEIVHAGLHRGYDDGDMGLMKHDAPVGLHVAGRRIRHKAQACATQSTPKIHECPWDFARNRPLRFGHDLLRDGHSQEPRLGQEQQGAACPTAETTPAKRALLSKNRSGLVIVLAVVLLPLLVQHLQHLV